MELIIIGLLGLMQIELGGYMWHANRKKAGLVTPKRPTFVDTSVLMDGRIIAAVQAGFIPDALVIPRSVIAELQLLADGSDSDKRARARHGLDLAAMLQDIPHANVTLMNDAREIPEGVDNRLLALAKKHHGSICTIDFNLNKVAVVEGITVLNINELAQQLRMNHLPGEKVSLKVMQKGNDSHQGVGYLSDGTMVVIEHANADIGKVVEVEFIRSLQTVAGRMLFAKKLHQDKKQATPKSGDKPAMPNAPRKKIIPAKTTRSKKNVHPEDSLMDLLNNQ